jgi:hypothetical protein
LTVKVSSGKNTGAGGGGFGFGCSGGRFLLHTPVTIARGSAGGERDQHQQRDPDGTLTFLVIAESVI